MEANITYKCHHVERSEEELVAAAKKDRKQFEPLYKQYYKRIFLFVYHRLGDKSLAADITSQVFLKAMSNLVSYVPKGLPFSSWLFRIAINECNAHFRKNKPHIITLNEEHSQLLIEEISIDWRDEKEALKQALKSLKTDELVLIELRFFENLKFQEIAGILSLTENNCKVKTYRILDKLKMKLKK